MCCGQALYVPNAEVLTAGGTFAHNKEKNEWDTPESAKYILHNLLAAHREALQVPPFLHLYIKPACNPKSVICAYNFVEHEEYGASSLMMFCTSYLPHVSSTVNIGSVHI